MCPSAIHGVWPRCFPQGQLQMLPPDVHLPLPARRLPTQPSLSETRSEICATLSMAECRTSDDCKPFGPILLPPKYVKRSGVNGVFYDNKVYYI